MLSGDLETAGMDEPHPFPPAEKWGYTQHHPFRDSYDSNRRSVYLMTQRIQRHPFLALFDGPDTNAGTASRPIRSFTSGPISAYAEVVDFDNGAYATNVVGATLGGNRTAWSLQGGFMFVPEKWEAAIRYEDLDTTTNTEVLTIGINYYMGAADTKWQLNYSSTTDEVSAYEFDWSGIGLVASV